MKPFHELVDLARRGERRLVEYIEPPLASVRLFSPCKMALQRRGHDARLGQFLRSTRGGSKAFDLVAFGPRSFPDYGQRRCFASTGDSIQANDLLAAHKNIIDHSELWRTQLRMAVLDGNPQRRRNQHRIAVGPLIAALHTSDDLLLDADHFSSGIERCSTPF